MRQCSPDEIMRGEYGIFVPHKYIRIPFTNIRLIFENGQYIGWYRYK